MKLTIDRKWWVRGESLSMLLIPNTGKMCCVGFYCLALGVDPRDILGVSTIISGISERPMDINNSLETMPDWTKNTVIADDTLSALPNIENLYKENDRMNYFTEEERESNIKALFAEKDVEVEFIN